MSDYVDRLKQEIAQLDHEAGIPASVRKRGGGILRAGGQGSIVCRESTDGPTMALPAVCRRLRVSRITVWRMVKAGQFPTPLDTGKRHTVWRALDVNAWCKGNAAHFERVIARILPAAIHR